MMNLKKMIALIMSCMLALGCFCAYAEDTVDVILNAGTTQSFSDQAVSEDDLKLILQAGLSAASAINQQPWYFAAITNKEVMAEISAGSGFGGAPAGSPKHPGCMERYGKTRKQSARAFAAVANARVHSVRTESHLETGMSEPRAFTLRQPLLLSGRRGCR